MVAEIQGQGTTRSKADRWRKKALHDKPYAMHEWWLPQASQAADGWDDQVQAIRS